MITVCNEVPEEPVLSLKSNCIFEKRLVIKYIKENGKDPVSGDDMEEADLVNVNCKSKVFVAMINAITWSFMIV